MSINMIKNFGIKYTSFIEEVVIPVLEDIGVERWVIEEIFNFLKFDKKVLYLKVYDKEYDEYNYYHIPYSRFVNYKKKEKKLRVLSLRKNVVSYDKKKFIFIQYLPGYMDFEPHKFKFNTFKELFSKKFFSHFRDFVVENNEIVADNRIIGSVRYNFDYSNLTGYQKDIIDEKLLVELKGIEWKI